MISRAFARVSHCQSIQLVTKRMNSQAIVPVNPNPKTSFVTALSVGTALGIVAGILYKRGQIQHHNAINEYYEKLATKKE